ncbi:hypothetical protein FQA39_LY06197 [Lamprigera yunnana]|nr:hypothetical protein FQA39_LY06197 [Lamprigera yunnana]
MHVYIILVFSFLCVTIGFCTRTSNLSEHVKVVEKEEYGMQKRILRKSIMNDTSLSFGRGLKEQGRGKKKKHKQDLLSRILPMLIIPFLLQTAIIPIMLTTLKFMLLKSAIIGKIAIILGVINMLSRNFNKGGLYTHEVNLKHNQNDEETLLEQHYGYGGVVGGSEYGAYINRRK